MKLTFFTGAGISAESGVPTFRDVDTGLWTKYDTKIVASSQGIKSHLDQVLSFHNEFRQLISQCQPNHCHHQIARLEDKHDINVITTNIDDLHERAGSTKVTHLHGSLHQACDINKDDPYSIDQDINVGDLHPITGLQLRHNTVLFGELLSAECYTLYNQIVDKSDMLIIIGSSLSVHPSSEITHYNKNIYYINPTTPKEYEGGWNIINKTACEGIDQLISYLK